MSTVELKFNLGEVFYTFDPDLGVIHRHVVSQISLVRPISINTLPTTKFIPIGGGEGYLDSEAYTESEVRELANAWLLEKSISMFTSVGL